MEPIGLCGGGVVALVLLLVAVVGTGLIAGGIALAIAKLGVTIDAMLKPETRGESNDYTLNGGSPPDDAS